MRRRRGREGGRGKGRKRGKVRQTKEGKKKEPTSMESREVYHGVPVMTRNELRTFPVSLDFSSNWKRIIVTLTPLKVEIKLLSIIIPKDKPRIVKLSIKKQLLILTPKKV